MRIVDGLRQRLQQDIPAVDLGDMDERSFVGVYVFVYPLTLITTAEGLALLRDYFEEVDRLVYDEAGNEVVENEPRGYIYSVIDYEIGRGKEYRKMLEESKKFFDKYLRSLVSK